VVDFTVVRGPAARGPFALDLPHGTVMLAATEDRMEQQSAAGLVLLFALANAWLARRRDRSAARWFVGSLLLPPFVWLLTLYLLTRTERPAAATTPSPAWGWIKLVALASAAVLLVFAVFLNVAGQPQGGAVATTQPQPVQTP